MKNELRVSVFPLWHPLQVMGLALKHVSCCTFNQVLEHWPSLPGQARSSRIADDIQAA